MLEPLIPPQWQTDVMFVLMIFWPSYPFYSAWMGLCNPWRVAAWFGYKHTTHRLQQAIVAIVNCHMTMSTGPTSLAPLASSLSSLLHPPQAYNFLSLLSRHWVSFQLFNLLQQVFFCPFFLKLCYLQCRACEVQNDEITEAKRRPAQAEMQGPKPQRPRLKD